MQNIPAKVFTGSNWEKSETEPHLLAAASCLWRQFFAANAN